MKMNRLITTMSILMLFTFAACSIARSENAPIMLPTSTSEDEWPSSDTTDAAASSEAVGEAITEENGEIHISLGTVEDILSVNLWNFEEEELFVSLSDSGWESFDIAGSASHIYLKQLNGLRVALRFDCFDSGKIKSVSLNALVRAEETRTQLEEALQNIDTFVWSDARSIVLMPNDADYVALSSQWILDMREVVYSAGGTLTEGAMRFSGNTVDEISDVIDSFFHGEESVVSVVVGEGYFKLPDGSHVETSTAVSPNGKALTYRMIRRHADWVNSFGNRPQPSAPDYRPNNIDGYFSVNLG